MDKQLSHFSHALRRMGMMMVMMLFAVMVYAQNIKVTGTVTDSSGEPIVGASVVVVAPRVAPLPTWTVNTHCWYRHRLRFASHISDSRTRK